MIDSEYLRRKHKELHDLIMNDDMVWYNLLKNINFIINEQIKLLPVVKRYKNDKLH